MTDTWNEPTYPSWECDYHTVPSPGAAFYQGTVKVFADDDEQAKERAISQLARVAPDRRSSIVIDEVRRVVGTHR